MKMSHSIRITAAILSCLLAGPLSAQSTAQADADRARREAELERQLERERAEVARQEQVRVREIEAEAAAAAREAERVQVDVEVEMREAESRLAEAARRVAELSTQRLPQVMSDFWSTAGRPVLGVNVGANSGSDGPVEGVEIVSVSPGGAAAEAGMRAGDIITSINGEPMGGDNGEAATRSLLDFMAGVEEGDELDVEYLRGGRSAKVTVQPRAVTRAFRFSAPAPNVVVPHPPVAPNATAVSRYLFFPGDSGLGDLEMVRLTEGLGRYFGTDEGLLVVRAPEDEETYKLQDGDVILNIGGREPNSVSHAVRILGSYQAGETLEIRIMRDKRQRTLEIEVPDNRSGGAVFEQLLPERPPQAQAAPAAPDPL